MNPRSEVTSLLAYRMRQLATRYGEGAEFADAVRQLLEAERGLHASPSNEQPVQMTNLSAPLRIVSAG